MNAGKLLWSLAVVLAVIATGVSVVCADTFTLDGLSPTLGPPLAATPADLLWDTPGVPGPPPPPPSIGVPFGAGGMGLVAGDIVDAISDGLDPVPFPHTDFFSVTRGSVGAAGSGVFIESTVGDTPPTGATPGHAGDIFVSGGLFAAGTNVLAPAGFGWTLGTTTGDEFNAGLVTPTGPGGDNVYSYDLATIGVAAPKYFSLLAGSPTLGILGAAPGDILAVGGPFGAAPVVFLPGVVLGIPVGGDMDALALFAPGGVFLGPGTIEYSLTAGTAAAVPASGGSGASVLGFAPGPVMVHGPGMLGLLPGDDLDALDVDIVPEPDSLVLFGLASLGLAGCRRFRRKKAM